MSYQNSHISDVAKALDERFAGLETKANILKAPELKELYDQIRTMPAEERSSFGQEVNSLRAELQAKVEAAGAESEALPPLDITAPMDVNNQVPELLPASQGTTHPLTQEIATIIDIFGRMGFVAEESREIDDQYHMFETLNFPKGHPARDDYDTFMTVETDSDGEPLIAPAHTSTMQNRTLRKYRENLARGEAIAAIVPDRVFRNEDLDARHEHTFYQVEGIYVAKGVHAGMLIATLQEFLQAYYGKELDVRVNPFYFPFTEPSFEFALSCPFCDTSDSHLDAMQGSDEQQANRTQEYGEGAAQEADAAVRQESAKVLGSAKQQEQVVRVVGKKGCSVCSHEGWIELLGCGMIHPNVLKAADIDPNEYTGFAFGCGIDRLVMMKSGIEDVRHFESAKLDFLEQF